MVQTLSESYRRLNGRHHLVFNCAIDIDAMVLFLPLGVSDRIRREPSFIEAGPLGMRFLGFPLS